LEGNDGTSADSSRLGEKTTQQTTLFAKDQVRDQWPAVIDDIYRQGWLAKTSKCKKVAFLRTLIKETMRLHPKRLGLEARYAGVLSSG
jgi:hypothetical protein